MLGFDGMVWYGRCAILYLSSSVNHVRLRFANSTIFGVSMSTLSSGYLFSVRTSYTAIDNCLSQLLFVFQPTIFVSSFTLPYIDSVMFFEVVFSTLIDCDPIKKAKDHARFSGKMIEITIKEKMKFHICCIS